MPGLIGVLVAVAVIAACALAIRHARARREWKRMRQEVPTILDTPLDELSEAHPNQLRDRLHTVRDVEAIHHATQSSPKIRESDRASIQRSLSETRLAVEKIHEAMNASVKRRVDRGLVIAAMESPDSAALVVRKEDSGQ